MVVNHPVGTEVEPIFSTRATSVFNRFAIPPAPITFCFVFEIMASHYQSHHSTLTDLKFTLVDQAALELRD